jgi:polar amino acid transport system substrate-binding protein
MTPLTLHFPPAVHACVRWTRRCLPSFAFVAVIALGGGAAAAQSAPLRCGVDGTFAPHAMVRLDGKLEGFQIDLFTEMAKRMGRELVIENGEHSGMIPALTAGRYDFLCGPITVTKERAQNLIFVEPYLWSNWQFVSKRGSKQMQSEDDLRGKTIAVEKGTPNEKWVADNAQRLGMKLLSFSGQADAVQAVLQGRAYAYTNGGSSGMKYLVSKVPGLQLDWTMPNTRQPWSAPLRKDNVALRDQMEDTLACMKKDGFVAMVSKKWFGTAPKEGDAEITVYPGYGVEGFEGFDPRAQVLNCKGA